MQCSDWVAIRSMVYSMKWWVPKDFTACRLARDIRSDTPVRSPALMRREMDALSSSSCGDRPQAHSGRIKQLRRSSSCGDRPQAHSGRNSEAEAKSPNVPLADRQSSSKGTPGLSSSTRMPLPLRHSRVQHQNSGVGGDVVLVRQSKCIGSL